MSRPINKPLAKQLTPEIIALIGTVPDSGMALISEVLRLNGRPNTTLTSCDLQLLEVARRELSVRGLLITFDVDEAEKVELATGISRDQAQAFLLRRTRVVTIEFNPGAPGGNEMTKDIPFYTSASK
ncbi:hypothetical protein ABH908_000153 [Pseudomonas frederiksbergensis]|uniref:hypothetical protein n=1 Tax=Pseudomonas TaxID=286 RepID=UPI003D221C7D